MIALVADIIVVGGMVILLKNSLSMGNRERERERASKQERERERESVRERGCFENPQWLTNKPTDHTSLFKVHDLYCAHMP